MGEDYQGNGKTHFNASLLTHCPQDAIFMFVDAYDVIFLCDENEILEKYKTYYNDELVFGGEQNLGMYAFDDLYQFFRYPLKHVINT